jgi:hypothetical protein
MPTDHTGEHGGSLLKAQGPPPSSSGSSEVSPSSLIMARGRSRVRRISSDVDPFSEENLRKRCVSGPGERPLLFCNAFYLPHSGYHSLKSFDQTFHLEKRWKLVREMGSGAYGVVMSVRIPPPSPSPSPSLCLCFLTRLSLAQLQTRSRERLLR